MIINPLIALLFALAVVFFLYGVFEFIANQENEEKKTTGMMGVFMIMNMILKTFDIDYVNPEEGTVEELN
ncbi:MAG: hypothetical protein UU13_C0012G0022 [Candidatus Nomurabacteria bacterium GW2011_GWB1_40_7]|uniref:Uncharacterized protein n=1 Tax=Candidatus Nomurabacteria bacterium GW2011_GWB1_40_7 TaxID=1618744 RepID=A0A0G0T652_9BACT|nr:MAG: hypothetical protein UU13_C0012G0022 [Candidatus Nomurabacteria bacterium GW2011_GWB1_40_7]